MDETMEPVEKDRLILKIAFGVVLGNIFTALVGLAIWIVYAVYR